MKSFPGGSCEVVSGLPIYSSLSETSLSNERPYNLDIMLHIVTFYSAYSPPDVHLFCIWMGYVFQFGLK